MTKALVEKDAYVARFAELEDELASGRRAWFLPSKKAAIARFAELSFPTTRQEDWKYTSVERIAKRTFRHGAGKSERPPTASKAIPGRIGNLRCSRLVFVDGHYAAELSSLRALPDCVTAGSIAAAMDAQAVGTTTHLARHASTKDHAFVALNTAFFEDGAFVHVTPGKQVLEPIHIVFVSATSDDPVVSHPRVLVVVGRGSRATVIESYVSLGTGAHFTNAVTEIVLGENAVLDHANLQQESPEAFHIGSTTVHQSRNSKLASHSVSFGGAIVRNDLNVTLGAEGADCTLNGLYLASERQHVDNHTLIDHAKPHGTSRQLYKGVLGGHATGVFNGKIVVRPDAQKSDASQRNQNLLLSADAGINAKPQLEIFADDVKCTHGSATGRLDEDAIFYLRSRGLDPSAARRLLTCAFAREVVDRMGPGPIRVEIDALLTQWLSGVTFP